MYSNINLGAFAELTNACKEFIANGDNVTEIDLKNFILTHSGFEIGEPHFEYMCNKMLNGKYRLENDGFVLSGTFAILPQNVSEEEFNAKHHKFNELRSIISPAQRSPEWFNLRNTCISASDLGAVVGLNTYEQPVMVLIKKLFERTFFGNNATYIGKKFEDACVLNYSFLNNAHLENFGLLKHNSVSFLGASPDSIVSPFCRDLKTFSPLINRMIEIKCLTTRQLKFDGDIYDGIVPKYYYAQVQGQLECCDLDECDFIQYRIYEYETRKEFMEDTHPETEWKSIKYGMEKSVLIEIIPAHIPENYYSGNIINVKAIWEMAVSVYPPKQDMTLSELEGWVLDKLDELKRDETIRVNRVVYYTIVERNCTLIKRDKVWFAEQYPLVKNMWERIEFLRNNSDKLKEFENYLRGIEPKTEGAIPEKMTKTNNDKLLEFVDNMMNVSIPPKKKRVKKTVV